MSDVNLRVREFVYGLFQILSYFLQQNADGGLSRFVENIRNFMQSEKVKAKIRQRLDKTSKKEVS